MPSPIRTSDSLLSSDPASMDSCSITFLPIPSLGVTSKCWLSLEQLVNIFLIIWTSFHFINTQVSIFLIVHNTASCPSLMLAFYEPETQKSTAALVGLKAVSDPLQFFNLQSSAASVTAQRSTSLLPTGVGFINVHICHISI